MDLNLLYFVDPDNKYPKLKDVWASHTKHVQSPEMQQRSNITLDLRQGPSNNDKENDSSAIAFITSCSYDKETLPPTNDLLCNELSLYNVYLSNSAFIKGWVARVSLVVLTSSPVQDDGLILINGDVT